MKTVRWCGHPDPWTQPGVTRRLAVGALLNPDSLAFIRWVDFIRLGVQPGKTEFIVGPAHGFSQTYVFGPRIFTLEMTDADADLLTASPWDAAMFEVDGVRRIIPDWYDHAPPDILRKKARFLAKQQRALHRRAS